MVDSTKSQDDDFIDLSLIVDVLKDQWRIFSAILVCTAIIGVGAYFVTPPKWQAEATLRVGEIASFSSERSDDKDDDLIEPVGEVIARMHLAQFQDKVLRSPSLNDLDQVEVALFRKSLVASPVKETNFIEVTVSARTPQNARKMLEATIDTLLSIHHQKMQPAIQQIQARIKNLSDQISLKQKSLLQIKQALQESEEKQGKTIAALDLLSRQEADIQKLMDERLVVESKLLPSQMFATSIMDAVRVGNRPNFPRLSWFLIASLLAGGLLGMLVALFRYKEKRKGFLS